jgi:hypothetical protein
MQNTYTLFNFEEIKKENILLEKKSDQKTRQKNTCFICCYHKILKNKFGDFWGFFFGHF